MATYFLKTNDAKTIVLDFPSTAARKSTDILVPFAGVDIDDFISIDAKFPKDASFSAWVHNKDVVTVRFNNYTNTSVNLPPFSIRLLVLKKELIAETPGQIATTDISIKSITGSKILDLTDNLKLLNINSESLITVPSDNITNFPLGSIIYLNQNSTGQVSIAAQQGVIINSDQNSKKLKGQFSQAYLLKVAAYTWQLVGNIKN